MGFVLLQPVFMKALTTPQEFLCETKEEKALLVSAEDFRAAYKRETAKCISGNCDRQ